MHRLYSLLLVLALSTGSLSAQSSVWKISKGEQSLYIGGTCHILRESDYPLPSEFDEAYAAAEHLVLEVDPAILQDPAFTMQMMSEATYKDSRTLISVLSDEAYTALEEASREANMPIELFSTMKPGMLVMMVTLQKLMLSGVTEEGVDLHYAAHAKADGKTIGSLETADFQLDLIINLGEGMESELVFYSLQFLDQIDELFDIILSAWRSGDLDTINQIVVEDMSAYPDIYNAMLKDRNHRWIPQIEAMLATQPIEFVLVGVGHMPGDDGLIRLLEGKGYTVTQVKQ
jgi:uncharacterized protein YbaP (TraB family)